MNPPMLTTLPGTPPALPARTGEPPADAMNTPMTESTPEPITEPEPVAAEWRVACRDPHGRDRAVAVLVEQDTVLLVPPPGQAAVLSGGELDQLCQALTAAEHTAVPGSSASDPEPPTRRN